MLAGGLISFLVTLIVMGIVIYAVYLVLNMLPLPQPIKTLVYLVIAVIFLVMLLSATGISHGSLF